MMTVKTRIAITELIDILNTRPDKWTIGQFGRDFQGEPVHPLDPSCDKRCAQGWLEKISDQATVREVRQLCLDHFGVVLVRINDYEGRLEVIEKLTALLDLEKAET